uniref:exodeoxyribonuclease III n=1 Tax=Anolis carolinensis TaxID=28377 RepID=G1KVY1_ANOCA
VKKEGKRKSRGKSEDQKNKNTGGKSNNVNGLNAPQKRNKIYNKFKKSDYDIISLQETHIKLEHADYLTQNKLGQEFHSLDTQKKRGVVTYISSKIPAQLSFKDNEGRILGVTITIERTKILLCNIYAPNGNKSAFTKKLKDLISNKEFDNMIIMGDFNGVLNYEIDKNPGKGHRKKTYKGTLPKDLQNFKEEYNLVDIWRLHHEGERDYTFFSERHKSWSRIDMIWVSNSLSIRSQSIKISQTKLFRERKQTGEMALQEIEKEERGNLYK